MTRGHFVGILPYSKTYLEGTKKIILFRKKLNHSTLERCLRLFDEVFF